MLKFASAAALLALASASAIAGPQPTSVVGTVSQISDSTFISSPQVANRKGSKRVGGKNSKGKGGKYTGGSKK